ncbi:MAG: hypothetical protein FK731_00135 [Asgard group archaeon]|nr:hypothetical protein [Asgard group archaeon]
MTLYKVGIGMYDCTGPAAEQIMMGYADTKQKTTGIADRQWVRAFVIKDVEGKYICLAVADICMVFQEIKNEVIKRLKTKFKDLFKADNVMLSGTHTHSGPAGYSRHLIFTIISKGFCNQTFEVIVNGFVQAIIRAFENLKPAKIFINTSELLDCGGQRSREAWESNPKDERDIYGDTDKSFTLLKFIDSSGKLFGTISYFALHSTSVGIKNSLITADNRGYASRILECKYGNDPYNKDPGFIAAFPNANGGDVSPNVGKGHPPGGEEDFKRMMEVGDKLSQKTIEMINSDSEVISGNIRFGKVNVDMANVQIEGTDRKTCDGAFGASFSGASSEDNDSPIPIFVEGLTRSEFSAHDVPRKYSFRRRILTFLLDLVWHDMDDPKWVEEQGEKPILLPVGKAKFRGLPFFPHIFPLQIFTIGSLCIIGFPGEITSIAGIRLKNTTLDVFISTDIKYCVLNCYANSYSDYTTTKEEYSQQHYEGASTIFGPNQLEAYQQEYKKLAEKIKNNEIITSASIIVPSQKKRRLKSRVRFDDDPMGKDYGDVLLHPNSSYNCGEKVVVDFVGAHPRNNLRTMDTYLEIQRKEQNDWVTIYKDIDYETRFHWKRKGVAHSVITIEWHIPNNEQPGEYRITHRGDSKARWSKKITPYSGISNAFKVLESL